MMNMKITILGSGTSTGVPEIGCTCPVCMSKSTKDKRYRCSGLVEVDGVRILIDCGPDFREQMIRLDDFKPIDAVLVTHEPRILLEEITPDVPFYVSNTAGKKVEIFPVRVMHGKLPILGYRIGKMAWITDMLTMPEMEYEHLRDLDVLVMNALREKPHPTHQTLAEAIGNVNRLSPKEAYFIHMSHHAGLHEEIDRKLPQGMHFAYDGLTLTL